MAEYMIPKLSQSDMKTAREALEVLRATERVLNRVRHALMLTVDLSEIRTSGTSIDFYNQVNRFEISLIRSALRYSRGSQRQAARLLGLKPTTLNSKIKTHKIAITDFT